MKLALEIDGRQVNHVGIKSLEGSIEFCKDYRMADGKPEETKELITSLNRVLKLYKDAEHNPRWLARRVEPYPAFERGEN